MKQNIIWFIYVKLQSIRIKLFTIYIAFYSQNTFTFMKQFV